MSPATGGRAAVLSMPHLASVLATSFAIRPALGLSPASATSAASVAPSVPLVAGWCCAAVLLALAARSAARLVADRAPADPGVPGCGVTSRSGDAVHLATAAGMAAMAVPLGLPPLALVAFFSATTAFVAGTWLLRVARRRLALRRGSVAACRPAHALEPHHVAVGLTMIAMAARMTGTGRAAGVSGMPGMPGMAGMAGMSASSGWLSLGALSLIYVWAAGLFLGAGLAKAAFAQPAPNGTVAVLAAPVTVYACELTMTVVMGLMLLG